MPQLSIGKLDVNRKFLKLYYPIRLFIVYLL